MQLPTPTSAWSRVNGFGVYVAGRLRAAHKLDQAETARQVTLDVKTRARRAEDLSEETVLARADRDAQDDLWDTQVQAIRLALASASVDAVHLAPYTQIFPDTVRYFTEAPIPEQSARMGELITRMETALPEGHPQRAAIQTLKSLRQSWDAAIVAFQEAETAEALAWGQVDSAEAAWRSQMDVLYSELRAEEGRKAAERYFP